ncbi:hypothetical protein B0A52_04992 [Exophiala mesophila]|uniref:Uncharacterized protein n=1 Tax=Exophiala mesophila TaxID=212818 RepID=A0A438N6R6_EXOME|nr:hypothetical protein B0A52_04992 [Exophiala mesophila]
MEKSDFSPVIDNLQSPLSFTNTLTPVRSRRDLPSLRQPYRHSVSTGQFTASRTVREFKPHRQRWRLFAQGFRQWFITVLLCGLLAACLGTFGRLLFMTVPQIKAFNALIVLLSMFLGNNLTSSFREMAMLLRWRILSTTYRGLNEFDLIMHCESLRKVVRLAYVARTKGQAWFWLNKTQMLCLTWIAVNVVLQVLVALLGLTYNLDTSSYPARKFGEISIANYTIIRDVWASETPSLSAQFGSANSYGIQGQDYLYVDIPPPGQGNIPSYGKPGTPTIYANKDYTTLTYVFQDLNIQRPDISLLSHRNVSVNASCVSLPILQGGNGSSSIITYLDKDDQRQTLDVVRAGPGATTYVGVLNATCGPRCAEIWALQSSNGDTIPEPSFFKCQNTMTPMLGIQEYLIGNATEELYQIPELQARIFAGSIGWTGFNYTPGDSYQYVRYVTDSWWSPNSPSDADRVSKNIMEYSIGAVAAFDYNGPRSNVSGWFPVPAQNVDIQWRWSAAILGVVPFIHLMVLVCVILWGNSSIIRDESCLSTAKLLGPIVAKLGENGCLLTGEEIAQELSEVRIKYGWKEPDNGLVFRNEIDPTVVRHVGILEEFEGYGSQGSMPPGRYDGTGTEEESKGIDIHDEDEGSSSSIACNSTVTHRRKTRRSMSI